MCRVNLAVWWFMGMIFVVACGDDLVMEDPCRDASCGPGVCKWTRERIPYCECPEGLSPFELNCLVNDYKPMIYLYPPEPTEVTVRFADPRSPVLLHTYPAYGDGWRVRALPDGILEDPVTGERFYALFWEGHTAPAGRPKSGFVVAGEDTARFLEETLAALGLSWRERNEFIVFWLPVLEQNAFNFLHFSTDAWARRVPLEVSPPPDSVLRVSMMYEPLDRPPRVLPAAQVFLPFSRGGFTLVEWGGERLVSP
jgi:hypothetical protein